MLGIEKKALEYEKRLNIPYIQLITDQLSLVNDAFSKGDRERIILNLRCTLSLVSIYIAGTTINSRLKKQISCLGTIIDDADFVTEAKKIYHIFLEIIEEKTREMQEW